MRRRHGRRILAGIVLCCHLATVFGVPLPVSAARKGDEPFPCQDNPCGCRTAEECWTACCCFSPEERLAWARARNIEPPPYAEQPGSHRWEERRKKTSASTPACCHENDNAACAETGERPCASCEASDTEPCTDSTREFRSPSNEETPEPDDQDEEEGAAWVLGISALRCKGNGTFLNSSALAPVEMARMEWRPCFAAVDWLPLRQVDSITTPSIPAEPPPRVSL